MMRLFGSLLASSKASKHPLLVLERSLAAYLATNKQYAYEPRFFSAQPQSAIPQEYVKSSLWLNIVIDFRLQIMFVLLNIR